MPRLMIQLMCPDCRNSGVSGFCQRFDGKRLPETRR